MEQLIDGIYEAAVVPDLWVGVLDVLARRFETRGGLLFRASGDGIAWFGAGEIAEHLPDFISAGQMEDNPRLRATIALRHPGFVTDLDLFPLEEMMRLPMYAEYLIPQGFDAGAATIVRGAGSDAVVLSLEGFQGHSQARSAVAQLNLLRPHLARAAVVASRLQFERARSAMEGLQLAGVAGAVLDTSGRVRAANTLFDRAVGDLVLDQPSRLHFIDRYADRLLAEALEAIRAGRPAGRSIPLPARAGGLPTVAHLAPVVGRGYDLFTGSTAVLILSDAALRPPLGLDLLHGLFDLTPAEGRVARAMAEGRNPGEIATRLGVSVLTVRTQVRSILAKTGQRRSVDLVHLLTHLAAHLPPDELAHDDSMAAPRPQ